MNLLKENIKFIFEKIELYNKEIIFEVIEEFIDIDNIYKDFIDFILKSYLEELNTVFYCQRSSKLENSNDKIDLVIKELTEAESLANISIEIINRFSQKGVIFKYTNKKDFEDIKLKIIVRKEIFKIKTKSFLEKLFMGNEKEDLKLLYEQYNECLFCEEEDLNELKKFLNINEPNKDNLQEEVNKAQRFITWLDKLDPKDDITSNLYHILTNYPYHKNDKEKEMMWNKFYDFKAKKISENDYLVLIKKNYDNAGVIGSALDDIKSGIFTQIMKFINKRLMNN